MKIWRYSKIDSVLVSISIFHLSMTFFIAARWNSFGELTHLLSFVCLIVMTTYNIIVISHLFTHTPWFNSDLLNRIISMINSINIAQSVQVYHLSHVKNHHKYNNDRADESGHTKDNSSTYRGAKNGEHLNIFHYAFGSALESFKNYFTSYIRYFMPGSDAIIDAIIDEPKLIKAKNRQQVRLDTAVRLMAMIIFLNLSVKWFLFCYLPAVYLSLVFVNIQNYYEHYGANPDDKYANSVSFYGKIYNYLTFNDGYHQEHHLKYGQHWKTMPDVLRKYQKELDASNRIISKFPAILGFLDTKRDKGFFTAPKEGGST